MSIQQTPRRTVMSISDRLDEIEARANAATDGPWHAESRNVDDPYSLTTVYNVFHNGDTADRDLVAEVAYDNAEFIAHARTDVPAMLAALRAVLNLHQFYDQCDEGCCRYCEDCEHQWPCPTALAIAAALGEEQ